MNKSIAYTLVAASLVIAIAFIYIASQRDLSGLENTLFQSISLLLGLLGSYVLGKLSADDLARDAAKHHAKPAFRRMLALYQSLGRLLQTIEVSLPSTGDYDSDQRLETVRAIVIEQIHTANDSIADWEDIIPEEVEKLRESATRKPKGERK